MKPTPPEGCVTTPNDDDARLTYNHINFYVNSKIIIKTFNATIFVVKTIS
jgi:hypothetical protein